MTDRLIEQLQIKQSQISPSKNDNDIGIPSKDGNDIDINQLQLQKKELKKDITS